MFAWHERPGALTRLLPPWQPVRVRREAASLRDGRAELALPCGVRWVAQHGSYDPPHAFVDELASLPLRWRHAHLFEKVDAEHTRVSDRIDTPVPARLLRAMLTYRHRQLAADLAVHAAARAWCDRPVTVAVTVADPAMHPIIDGSGTVTAARPGNPARLQLGARFGMDMKLGRRYRISNRVVEFDEPHRIAWRHFNGHIWRYLFDANEDGTLVTIGSPARSPIHSPDNKFAATTT